MDDWFASAEFSRAPLARVLAEIWRQGLSGSLYVRADGVPEELVDETGVDEGGQRLNVGSLCR